MKKVIGALALILPLTSNAIPINDISVQSKSSFVISGIYGSVSRFDISFENQNLLVDVDIKFDGAPVSDILAQTWKNGIGSIWGSAFDLFDGDFLYDTLFNVDFVTTGQDYDINVSSMARRSNLLEWDYFDSGKTAAHEFGHMIGLYDEYAGGAVNPITGAIYSDSIMNNTSTTLPHHYDYFVDWLSVESGRSIWLTDDTGDHYYAMVPEPSGFTLLAAGLIAVSLRKRKYCA